MHKILIAGWVVVLGACGSASDGTTLGEVGDGGPVAYDAAFDSGSASDAGITRDSGSGAVGPVVPADSCAAEATWIYVVDDKNELLRFEPDSQKLTSVGTLNCPGSASPFSMAVGRDGYAYVLFDDMNLYRVSTKDATCTKSAYAPSGAFSLFGMGFVSNAAGSDDETLFIAGSGNLGTINLTSWATASVGALDGSGELTGNGNGELWGFFPQATPMAVRQLNKTTGAVLNQFDVSTISAGFLPTAWAFAFWGGRYYMFYQGALDITNLGARSSIYRLTPSTGVVEQVVKNTGHTIVGAGVSTCAPTILR